MTKSKTQDRFFNKINTLLVCAFTCFTLGCSTEQGIALDEVPQSAQTGSSSPSSAALPGRGTSAGMYAYPLKVSPNGRYLADQDNRPFRIQGDSAQSLIVNLTYQEADFYLSNRQAKGFNTVNVNLLEHKFGLKAPANRNGDLPFATPGDFSTPNEAYFAFADSIIDLAASRGMLVSLAPMYLGYNGGDEGWWAVLTNKINTQAVCYRLGLYIGNRYKNRKNILWVIGGDYLPPAGSEGEVRLHKFMEGIKAAGATQLWSGDWNAPCISTDERDFASTMDVNAVYTSGIPQQQGTTYGEARIAYEYSPPHPAYLKETGYEDENWVPGDPASVRKYEYWAILGGATAGGFFGNRDIWEFSTAKWWSGFSFGHAPWMQAQESAGTFDMMRLGQLLDSVPWQNLVPSGLAGMRTLVTAGGGAYGGQDYVTAAATDDGRALVAYLPPTAKGSRQITIDLRALRGPAQARWFDPTSGKYATIPRSPFPNTSTTEFVTPGKNSQGSSDWVLVLQTAK
jgi:hypothetical protein